MSDVVKGNAVIGQSGGPTAVINQSVVGVIEAVAGFDAVDRLLGARHGVRGMVDEDFVPLDGLDAGRLARIAATPGAALGSTRDKPDDEYCRKIFQVFEKHKVRYFFYIGGNDSAGTANIVNDLANEAKYELRVFHIPKTIDNDLLVTDHAPGFGSAAKFVASAVMGDDRDNASLPGIKINVIMGRNAGWLTAASVLARREEGDGPHLIYVPERVFDVDRFIEDVRATVGRLGRCQVAVSEGIVCDEEMEVHKDDGSVKRVPKPVAVKVAEEMGIPLERDRHDNIILSKLPLGQFLADYLEKGVGKKKLRIRSDTFGYLQRSFAGCVSPVDASEAREVGRKAVELAMSGDVDGSVAIRRTGAGGDYAGEFFRAELADVATGTRPLEEEYVGEDGNDVRESFRDYAAPLAGELPVIAKL